MYCLKTFGTIYRSNGSDNGCKGIIRGLTIENLRDTLENMKNRVDNGDREYVYEMQPQGDKFLGILGLSFLP